MPPMLAEVCVENKHLVLRREWIHRRVDSMSFTEGLMVRVWTSVDFTIPLDTVAFADGPAESQVYYLPIAILAKWPPVMRFDLRDQDGVPIPLLTSRKNRQVDAAVLRALAPADPSREQEPGIDELLGTIAEGDRGAATAAQEELVGLLGPHRASMDEASTQGWVDIRELVSPGVENSLLWARVEGRHGERQIVKCGYEQPVEQPLFFFRSILGALSWREISNVYAIPRVDWAQNYHLQIEAPAGLMFHSAEMVVQPPSEPPALDGPAAARRPGLAALLYGFAGVLGRAFLEAGRLLEEARLSTRRRLVTLARMAADPDRGVTSQPTAQQFNEPAVGTGYAWNNRHRAYLYVSRAASPFAVAKFSFIAPNRSVDAPFAAALMLAVLMTLITAAAGSVATHDTDAVTALVVVPALLGLLVLRPGEHPLVHRHIAGVRALLIAVGATPVLAALVLVTHTHTSAGNVLPFFIPLAAMAWLGTVGLGLSVVLPARDYRRT